ncbi:MAG: DEAD/DEAH box helicase, partial [Bacillota bacterium]
NELQNVIAQEQWSDFRCYVAHLWSEKKNLDAVLADTEQLLRHTFGYVALRSEQSETGNAKAEALLRATRDYVQQLARHPENAILADSTGFTPEGVGKALMGLNQLENKLSVKDWDPGSLFGDVNNSLLPNLIGIMLNVPELRGSLEEITRTGLNKKHLAEITTAWVNGVSIPEIAKKFFAAKDADMTSMITDTCKAIYKTIVNSGPWGLAALSKMPASGLDFEKLPDDLKRRLNVLPAMIYHGVRTEEAVLMRVNSVPRSIAEPMGEQYKLTVREGERSVTNARQFLRSLSERDWNKAVSKELRMSGADYREVWRRLNGE